MIRRTVIAQTAITLVGVVTALTCAALTASPTLSAVVLTVGVCACLALAYPLGVWAAHGDEL